MNDSEGLINMISKMKQMFQTVAMGVQPYLATDIVVPAVFSLVAIYLFLVATFSLDRV